MLLCETSAIVLAVALLSTAATIGEAAPAPTLSRPPIVKTNSGDIQGSVATSFLDRRTYYSFRGIPYAQPPIGPLRFKVSAQKTGVDRNEVSKNSFGSSRPGATKNRTMAGCIERDRVRRAMSADNVQFDRFPGRRRLSISKCVHAK